MVAVGTIILYGGASVPDGYLPCDGSVYDGALYPELYGILAGAWDSFRGRHSPSGSFRTPDLRGLVPIGVGSVGTSPTTSARAGGRGWRRNAHANHVRNAKPHAWIQLRPR